VPPTSSSRNQPCPCGSGRKFKLCCGADRPRESSKRRDSKAAPLNPTARAPVNGRVNFGPLTEVSGLRTALENFQRVSPNLPADGRVESPNVRGRRSAAERYRQRGEKLVELGQLAAAVTAFTEAVRLDPRDAAAQHALGRVLLDLGRVVEAAESLELAVALQDDAYAYCNLALALRRQDRDEQAIAAYRRAIELEPTLTEAHVRLSELLEPIGEYDEAAQLLHRAASLADTVSGRFYLGRALMLDGDFLGAEERLREAAALDPTNDEVFKYLGDALARQGRFAEAVAEFDHTLALNPRQVSAYFAAAEVRKSTDADRPRLTRMLAALGDSSLGEYNHLLLHFAAGKVFDDLGEYEAAMRHYEAANRIRGRNIGFDAPAFEAEIDRLISRFTQDFFAANAAFGRDDETPLLIVGLPRSGTTLVEQILSRHPQIAGGGEQAFWIRWTNSDGNLEANYLTPETGQDVSQRYLALLRGIAPGAPRVTDKLPFNVLCLGIVHLLLPKARIVQCRRHPVDNCLSMYFTHFQQALSFATDKGTLAAAYRQYARLMDHWRSVLPPDRLFEIEYEKLVEQREAVTRELIAFTGLQWHEACLSPERNQRPVLTASLWQARQPVYATSVARWRHYEPWLGELDQLLTEH